MSRWNDFAWSGGSSDGIMVNVQMIESLFVILYLVFLFLGVHINELLNSSASSY